MPARPLNVGPFMQQSDVIRVVRGLLAAACVVAASICIAAGHVVSHARIQGVMFAMPGGATGAYWAASKWLFIFGGVLLAAACVLGVLALLPTRRPAA